MAYQVRNLESSDFPALMRMEREIFGAAGEEVLGPYYVRLCCDFFSSNCFLVLSDGEPVGYLLSFLKGREAYCSTLAVAPSHQGTRAVHLLIRAFVRSIMDQVDVCWFTVSEENQAARALHQTLGATEVGRRHDFYGPGDTRIVSCIDRDAFQKLRQRYEKLGLVPPRPAPRAEPTVLLEAAQ
ncbi:MAG: GNAT family N-acetyltransferase [Myxococcales bacterium]|nr:GNAT family N-acetyltransferase [Polyangiaceae bacterium]MDW8248077.1 GNAT family N-acetyltransferase [Myxococcales bacterium]